MRKVVNSVVRLAAMACLAFVGSIVSPEQAVAKQETKSSPDTTEHSTVTSSKSQHPTTDGQISFRKHEKSVDVLIDGESFTTLDYGTYVKPILYPIYGPGQIGMTRNWPMKEGVDGEAHDHPHHKSMWISHEISGVDFWAEKGGSVKSLSVEYGTDQLKGENAIRAQSAWIRDATGETILTDETIYRFGVGKNSRLIDCTVTFKATHGDFQFEDTKEGLFAIRTHPDLRLTSNPKQGVKEVFGQAVNSNGESGKEIWGKPAKWVLYQGPIDGTPMSIAMYDAPTNHGHPTTWHARDYGLVAANPFGMHHFLGKPKGEGAVVVKKGDSLTLRYRVEFIRGLATTSDVEQRYESFCNATGK